MAAQPTAIDVLDRSIGFRSRGVEFVEPEPTPYPFGVRIAALDPDGNRIELRQRRRGQSTDG